MNAQATIYKYQNPNDPGQRGPQRPNDGGNEGRNTQQGRYQYGPLFSFAHFLSYLEGVTLGGLLL